MILTIVLSTIVTVGLTAIWLAEPRSAQAARRADEVVVWNDELERRLLNERVLRASGWW